MDEHEIKAAVRRAYGSIAGDGDARGCGSPSSCCGAASPPRGISRKIGYAEEELKRVPEGADLGLGCGNPVALGSLQGGEIVLDLGSGGGLDAFLAAERVGPRGRVIGVDMTPEMIARARENARRSGADNVEFRLGEIEHLPVADESVDVVISNCVINLSTDKPRVFREAFRALKPGGRLMISDTVLLRALPETIQTSVAAYTGCLAGALPKEQYLATIREAGFERVAILQEASLDLDCYANDPTVKAIVESSGASPEELKEAARSIASISVSAVKPTGAERTPRA